MKSRMLALTLAVVLAVILTVPVSANAEAGPDFTVLIDNAPGDTTVFLRTPDGVEVELNPVRRGWESCFRLYYHRLYEAVGSRYVFDSDEMEALAAQSVLHIVSPSAGLDLTVPMPEPNQMLYNHLSVMHLDPAGVTASLSTPAYMAIRNTLLVILRVSVTLITEGVIFFLMGYRMKRSWMVFLGANLITQILLNLAITGNYLAMGYWELLFVFSEILIFVGEAVVFAVLLREQKPLKGAGTAILANAVSCVCGGLLLAYLPL